MPNFLSIDQSLRATGICLMNEVGECLRKGTISTDGLSQAKAIVRIAETVATLIREFKPVYITVEEPTRMAASASLVTLCEIYGVLRYVSLTHGYECADSTYPSGFGLWLKVQNQSSMKKFVLHDGAAKKDSGYLLKVFQATGITFEDDNQADATMHAIMALRAWRLVNGKETKDQFTLKELSALTRLPEPKVSKLTNEEVVKALTVFVPKPKKKRATDE